MTTLYDDIQLTVIAIAVVCVLVPTLIVAYKLAVALTCLSDYLSIKSADIITKHDYEQFAYELNSLKTAVANAINRKAYSGTTTTDAIDITILIDTTAISKDCIEQFVKDYLLYNIDATVTNTHVHLASKQHVDIDSFLHNFNISTQQN